MHAGRFVDLSTAFSPLRKTSGVYEWVEKDGNEVFVINMQDCVQTGAIQT